MDAGAYNCHETVSREKHNGQNRANRDLNRNPPLVHAHIQSVEYPEMSAGVGILNSPLPKMYLNVAAGPNGQLQDDQKWKLDFILPQRADLDNN